MADTFTSFLNLVKPEPNSSRDTWGSKWNENAATLDAFAKSVSDAATKLASDTNTALKTLSDGLKNHTHPGYLTENKVNAGQYSDDLELPIGSYIWVNNPNGGSGPVRNSQIYPMASASGGGGYSFNGAVGYMNGSWRARGSVFISSGTVCCLAQRVG